MGRKPTTERCFYWTTGGYFYRLVEGGGLWAIDPNRRSDTWELLCKGPDWQPMTLQDLITNIDNVGQLKEIPVSSCPYMDRPLPPLDLEIERKCNEQGVRTLLPSRAR